MLTLELFIMNKVIIFLLFNKFKKHITRNKIYLWLVETSKYLSQRASIYKKLGKYKQALEMHELYMVTKDFFIAKWMQRKSCIASNIPMKF